MFVRGSIVIFALTAALALMTGAACAFDATRYPDWSGQWRRPAGVGTQWDQTKRSGLAQQAPLTPQYQARLEASVADQARGGQGDDARVSCITAGMPRIMTGTRPFELVVLPAITYVYGEGNMPRRIYTDGRDFPKNDEPSYMGYSSANGSTRTKTANTTRSKSRPAISRGRAPMRIPEFSCTRTTKASSRSGSISTRPTRTSCTSRLRPPIMRSRGPGQSSRPSAANKMCNGRNTTAPRATITWPSARNIISFPPTAT